MKKKIFRRPRVKPVKKTRKTTMRKVASRLRKRKVRSHAPPQYTVIRKNVSSGTQASIDEIEIRGKTYILRRELFKNTYKDEISPNLVRLREIYKALQVPYNSQEIPGIVPIYEMWEEPNSKGVTLFLVMKKCETLNAALGRMKAAWDSKDNLKKRHGWAVQIAKGLRYLHEALKKHHSDLKPENILVNGSAAYVADFGCANEFSSFECGTPFYESPEAACNDVIGAGKFTTNHQEVCDQFMIPYDDEALMPKFKNAFAKSDVFSYGLLLLSLLFRDNDIPSRYSRNRQEYFDAILQDTLKEQVPATTTAQALAQVCLLREPALRLDWDDIIRILTQKINYKDFH